MRRAFAAALVVAAVMAGAVRSPAAPVAPVAPAAPAAPDSISVPSPAPLGGARGAGEGPSFAVAAYDSATSTWGIACASSALEIGARAGDATASAGALLSIGAGPGALPAASAALAGGASPESALVLLTPPGTDPGARIGLAVDRGGRVAAYAGSRLPGFAGALVRGHFGGAGLGLRAATTLEAMASAFDQKKGDLGEKLVAALQAGEKADGDPFAARGKEGSSSLLVVRAGGNGSDRLTDLRVDLDSDPVGALARLYARHAETFLPAAHVRYGDEARRRGDEAAAAREYAAAEAGFRSAVSHAPKDADALNELAWFLATRGGDPLEALRFAEAAVAARNDDPNLLDTLAEAAYRAGDLEQAIAAAARAARLAWGNERYAERLRAFRAAKAALAPGAAGAAPRESEGR